MDRPTPYKKEGEESDGLFGTSLSERLYEKMMEQRIKRPAIVKVLSNVQDAICYPSRMLARKIEKSSYERHVKKLADCKGFRNFEKRLRRYIDTNAMSHLTTASYIEALLIVDELDGSLRAVGKDLPDNVNALDVGCGKNWFYAEFLYNVLRNYKTRHPRTVRLDGIDLKTTEKRIANFYSRLDGQNMSLVQGDVLDMDCTNYYDFILLHKMLTSPSHFKKFGLKPRSLDSIMDKCSDMLTEQGIQITAAYQSAGEYWNLAEHIPMERRIGEFDYKVELGNENLNYIFTPGIDREYRCGVCISKK